MRRLKTVRRPPIYPNEPSHLPCSSLTHPAAVLTPSIGVLRWIRAYWNLTPFSGPIRSVVPPTRKCAVPEPYWKSEFRIWPLNGEYPGSP